jgi:DNA transposition AAA+ family ATPase
VVRAVREADERAAEDVIAMKDDIRRLADEFLARQSGRIGVQEARHLDLDKLDKLRRIYTLAKRVAKDFVPGEVASKA